MSAEPSGRFVWPPKPVVESEPVEVVTQPPSAGFLDLIETQFLGRTGLSFDRRTRLTGWAADPQDAYCQRCGGSVGQHEADGEGCGACRRKRLPWERALRLGPYTGQIRAAVLDLKFRGWHQTGAELGRVLGEYLGESLERAQIPAKEAAIVPVPAHWTRRVRFGVDHTLTLGRAASRASGVPLRRVLARRAGPSQLQVPVSQRMSNVSGVFRVRRGRDLPVSVGVVVVLDDVRTTGATLRSACRAIRSGFEADRIWVLTAGVTPSLDRRERENRPLEDVASVEVVEEKEICRNGGRDD
jgi:predicted amidophosphoribosyltransferase